MTTPTTLYSWKTPATSYPTHKVGNAQVIRSKYTKGHYPAYGVRGFPYYRVGRSLPIRELKIGTKTWMVDDPPHWWAMQDHSLYYTGHVLCAGLGLGLIVHALAKNPAVKEITVVEQDKDVIDLISPHIPKCKIIHGDFWDYDCQCDGVFYDLFVGDAREIFTEALRTYLILYERYPNVRIHGFPNDYFKRIWFTVRSATGRSSPDAGRVLRDHNKKGRTPR